MSYSLLLVCCIAVADDNEIYVDQVGATANIGISENNLLGKSQKIRLNLLASERENRADFSFTEPFFQGE